MLGRPRGKTLPPRDETTLETPTPRDAEPEPEPEPEPHVEAQPLSRRSMSEVPSVVRVVVKRARRLRAKDFSGASDPCTHAMHSLWHTMRYCRGTHYRLLTGVPGRRRCGGTSANRGRQDREEPQKRHFRRERHAQSRVGAGFRVLRRRSGQPAAARQQQPGDAQGKCDVAPSGHSTRPAPCARYDPTSLAPFWLAGRCGTGTKAAPTTSSGSLRCA
jgi:hypothetical protein